MELFRGYIQTQGKQPLEKFKGRKNLSTLADVQGLDEYAGEDDYTKQGKIGFVIHSNVRGKEAIFFVAISKIEVDGENYLDWFVEPLNDWGHEFSNQYSDDRLHFGFLYKLIIPLDQIQRKALKSQQKIIKMKNNTKQKITSNPNMKRIESQPISLSGGIKYQYIFEREETRVYNRHIDAWEVRGHYRHYKSGKVVFIKPFKKGEGETNDKKYAVTL